MRQIHAAIEHWRRGDFECAITLASAAEAMLPDVDTPPFTEVQNITRINEISVWLMHGGSSVAKGTRVDTVIIEEVDTVVAIHRAIMKFETVFWKDKTPQMTSFRNADESKSSSIPTEVKPSNVITEPPVWHGPTSSDTNAFKTARRCQLSDERD